MPNSRFVKGDVVQCVLDYRSLLTKDKIYEVVQADASWVYVTTDMGHKDGFDQGHFVHAAIDGRKAILGTFTIAHFNDTLEAYEHFGVFTADVTAEREAAKAFPDGQWLVVPIKKMEDIGHG